MKKLIFLLPLFILVFESCSSQIYLDKSTIENIYNTEQFTFMAERANPTNYDVINIANSIPNYNSSRMLQLDYGYTLMISNDELVATLPYFGRAYSANVYNTEKQSLRFTSKDFSVTKSQNKKGNFVFRIKPNDVSHINMIFLEIYKNGKASLSVDANDRQPISFDGYMMKNEVVKK